MFLTTRRRFVLGALSVAAGAPALPASAAYRELPAGSRTLFDLDPMEENVEDIVPFPDGSFALSIGRSTRPTDRIVYLLDADGTVQWRTALGDEESFNTVRAVVAATGDKQPGFYAATGFKNLWRLGIDGSLLWKSDLFELVAMNCQLSMAPHSQGGVLVAGVATRPEKRQAHDCHNCAVVRLAEDGTPMWTWWRDDLSHTFATAIAVTDEGVAICQMTAYDPTTGSAGDSCTDRSGRQWTVWLDPEGQMMLRRPWPDDRMVQAMTLDRSGRLVFYGTDLSNLRLFFEVQDASKGQQLDIHAFGQSTATSFDGKWFHAVPEPIDATELGTSIVESIPCRPGDCAPNGAVVRTLTLYGQVEEQWLPGTYEVRATATLPDGRHFLAVIGHEIVRVPLP